MAISVVINTYNASRYLERVLETVKGFDEVVVCDMESTDETVAIAQGKGCKVVTFSKNGVTICEPARNFAIQSASEDWVLVVDADELVTEELRDYLYDFTNHSGDVKGLLIARKNYLTGTFLRSTYPDYQLRFFRRNSVDWPPIIHARPIIDGKVEKIPSKRKELALIHLGTSMRDMIDHYNNYTDNELDRRGVKSVGFFSFVFSPAFRFIKSYIFKGGIFLGKAGLIQAQKDAFYKYMMLVKMHERRMIEKMNR